MAKLGMMTPGFAKPRHELPWLPYPEKDRMFVINAHNFDTGITLGWETPQVISSVGDTVVNTDGSLVIARNAGEATSRTVNGVVFAGSTSEGQFTIVQGSAGLAYQGGGIGTAFEAMMDIMLRSGTTTVPRTITLSGLTVSSTYLLQVFIADNRTTTTGNRIFDLSVAGYTITGQRVGDELSLICRFVAGSTSETLSLDYPGVSATRTINGYQLRAI